MRTRRIKSARQLRLLTLTVMLPFVVTEARRDASTSSGQFAQHPRTASHHTRRSSRTEPYSFRGQPPASPSSASSSSSPRRDGFGDDQGIFQNVHLNNFPVRAAIDIGTGGVASLCIARVDAARQAVVKVLYQTQLPLYLEAQPGTAVPSSSSSSSSSQPPLLLSESTITDIKNKMRVLNGAMRRDAYEGLSERAAVLTWPLCEAVNAAQLASELTRELKLDVRVLGHNFDVTWPFAEAAAVPDTATTEASVEHESETVARGMEGLDVPGSRAASATTTNTSQTHGKGKNLKALIRDAKARRRRSRQDEHARTSASSSSSSATAVSSVPAKTQVDHLAFLSHAAMAQCMAAQRMLVIAEDPQQGLSLVGTDTTAELEARDLLERATGPEEIQAVLSRLPSHVTGEDSSANKDVRDCGNRHGRQLPSKSSSSLAQHAVVPLAPRSDSIGTLTHRLPVDVAEAHRLCITAIQHRAGDDYGLHTSSPNPLLAKEFDALVGLLTPMLAETLPAWVRRKSALGGVIAGTSHNGGLLNLAARVSQKTSISLDHLEVHARHHFCGLTDVLLATNFPNPLLVLPSVALACALCRALDTPRVAYLPELTTACALLVQPGLWAYSRSAAIRSETAKNRFYHSTLHRTFSRPHRKDNPTAAPGAAAADPHLGRRELAQETSYRGT